VVKIIFGILAILLVFGGGVLTGFLAHKSGTDPELSKYRAILAGTQLALEKTERDYNSLTDTIGQLAAISTGINNTVISITTGQQDIDGADKRLNDAIRKHGELLGRLTD